MTRRSSRISIQEAPVMIVQMLLGGVAAAGVALKLFWRRFLVLPAHQEADSSDAARRSRRAEPVVTRRRVPTARTRTDAAPAEPVEHEVLDRSAGGWHADRARVVPRPRQPRLPQRRAVYPGALARGLADYEALREAPLFQAADAGRPPIGTTVSELEPPPDILPGGAAAAVLEHDRIPFVTYPYEWTFGMLKDAAVVQLDLLARRSAEKLTLKDAIAVQRAVARRPAHLRRRRLVRAAAPQRAVDRLPPVLHAVPLPADVPGLPRRPVPAAGCRARWTASRRSRRPASSAASPSSRRASPLNVALARAAGAQAGEDHHAGGQARHPDGGVQAGDPDRLGQEDAQARRPARVEDHAHRLDGLRRQQPRLRAAGAEQKKAFVSAAAETRQPGHGLGPRRQRRRVRAHHRDHADHVVAIGLRPRDRRAPVPVAQGRGQHADPPARRRPLRPVARPRLGPAPSATRSTSRGRPDLTLSLALVHHLSITRNVPLDEVVDWLASLGGTHVVEFPTARRQDGEGAARRQARRRRAPRLRPARTSRRRSASASRSATASSSDPASSSRPPRSNERGSGAGGTGGHGDAGGGRRQPPTWPSVLLAGVHLAALWAIAFVQPLFDLLGKNAAFFVARDNTPGRHPDLRVRLHARPAAGRHGACSPSCACFNRNAAGVLHLALIDPAGRPSSLLQIVKGFSEHAGSSCRSRSRSAALSPSPTRVRPACAPGAQRARRRADRRPRRCSCSSRRSRTSSSRARAPVAGRRPRRRRRHRAPPSSS